MLYWFLALSPKALNIKPHPNYLPEREVQRKMWLMHGRSSDLLPILNAFPASPNPSTRGGQEPVAKVLFNTFSLLKPSAVAERFGGA